MTLEPLRVGFIGAGVFSTWAIYPALHLAPIDLRAVCDTDEAKARSVAGQFGGVAAGTRTTGGCGSRRISRRSSSGCAQVRARRWPSRRSTRAITSWSPSRRRARSTIVGSSPTASARTGQDLALDAPVIDFVDRAFREATTARATDLHVEPTRGRVILRRRVDGMLIEAGSLAPDFGKAVVSRIKILSHLNIAERRLPQDGRARIRIDQRDFDLRVATMPTIHGEGVAVRFLSGVHQVPEIDKLGLSKRDEGLLRAQSAFSHGLIVVTGPTGSGKTTTLAAVLGLLNDRNRKLVTIEDPVEYQIEGINQIQVRPEIGLTFAHTLRSLLRFDPDIIMVGEMRDSETARIGVHASLTGHLVLTTLHTNSAASAVARLLDLGVEAYLVASTLRCVIAQRLVRRLCVTCREEYHDFPEPLAAAIPEAQRAQRRKMRLWKAVGCDRCGRTGYHGRAAIFEILTVDENIQKLIRPDVNASIISTAAKQHGMTTMIADGLVKCEAGITTVAEVNRVALDI